MRRELYAVEIAAIWIWREEYAPGSQSAIEFYAKQTASRKRRCRALVNAVREAEDREPEEAGNE